MPVAFSAVRATLLPTPKAVALVTSTNTIGMVWVSRFTARVAGAAPVTMASGAMSTQRFGIGLQTVPIGTGKAEIEPKVTAFHPIKHFQAVAQHGGADLGHRVILGAEYQDTYPTHRSGLLGGLLGGRRERKGRRSADAKNELPPFHPASFREMPLPE